MAMLKTISSATLLVLAQSATPLDRANADKALTRLKSLHKFTTDAFVDRSKRAATQCTAASQAFVDAKCKDKKASTECKQTGTFKPNVCCKGETDIECKFDKDGKEYLFGCCDQCLAAKTGTTAGNWCDTTGTKRKDSVGLSVCGTKAGTCGECKAGSEIIYEGSSQEKKEECEKRGKCVVGGKTTIENQQSNCKGKCYRGVAHQGTLTTKAACIAKGQCSDMSKMDEASCTSPATWTNNVWQDATWTKAVFTITADKTQKTCDAGNACYRCEGCGTMCPGDKNSCIGNSGKCGGDATQQTKTSESACTSAGGTWTKAQWKKTGETTESTCNAKPKGTDNGNGQWMKPKKWKQGDAIPDAAEGVDTCSTGPTHSEPSHIVTKCVKQATFLADAAAKTVAAAKTANAAYYADYDKSVIGAALVLNAKGSVTRAEMTLTKDACFVTIPYAKNHGKFTLDGTAQKSYALILDPINYADADTLSFKGAGDVSVLGGTNYGNIASTTTGKLELYKLTSSGNITIDGSTDTIIMDVVNNGGKIDFKNMGVMTLQNVKSSGTVTVNKGNYNGYDITNTGTITIEAGTVDLRFKCNTGGTLTIKEGVTGTVYYPEGCKGTMTLPAAIVVGKTAAPAVAKKVEGTLALAVPAAEAASFAKNAKVKQALASAIANSITGVDAFMVNIISVTAAARRLDDNSRRLSTTAVTVKYVVTLPTDNSVTVDNVKSVVAGTSVKTTLATAVNSALKMQGVTTTITVTSAEAVEKKESTGSTSWVSPSQSVSMTAVAVAVAAWSLA